MYDSGPEGPDPSSSGVSVGRSQEAAQTRTVAVLAGGTAGDSCPKPVRNADLVIAADSGLHLARLWGLRVDLVVGDLDSVDAGALDWARSAGVDIRAASVDKDQTDLELALEAAVATGCAEIVVAGGGGGRLSHLFANLGSLADPSRVGVRVRGWLGAAVVTIVHDEAELVASDGTLVSLVPIGGNVGGVVTTGLRWPLMGEELLWWAGRGVSNRLVADPATVRIASGVLAVIQEVGA